MINRERHPIDRPDLGAILTASTAPETLPAGVHIFAFNLHHQCFSSTRLPCIFRSSIYGRAQRAAPRSAAKCSPCQAPLGFGAETPRSRSISSGF